MDYETIYTSDHQPDVKRAIDVLAFVLAPVKAFADPNDPESYQAVVEMFRAAKAEAAARWFATRDPVGSNRS